MRALVKRGQGPVLSLEKRPDPVPDAGEVLIAVRAVGICGTDLHILEDVYPHADPLIPGHEFAGEIVGLGAGVEEWAIGDRVVGELHVGSCRTCELCSSGNPQICESKRALGTWTDGAFAELLALPSWLLHRIPQGVSYPAATLVEPAACAWHGMLERSRMNPGDRVLVVGHGPIGLLSAQIALARGASQVILVGRSRRGGTRLDAARALGVEVLDASTEDIDARVSELTGGRGVDLAVETAGTETSVASCVGGCRRGGRIAALGLCGLAAVPIPWDRAVVQDLDVAFSFSSTASSWEGVLGLTRAGSLACESLITHTLSLEDWVAGFEAVRSGQAVKVVLTP